MQRSTHCGTTLGQNLVLTTEVSSIKRSPNTLQYYSGMQNGVLPAEVCPHYRGPPTHYSTTVKYRVVSSLQRSSQHTTVLQWNTEWCPHCRGVLTSEVHQHTTVLYSGIQSGVLTTEVHQYTTVLYSGIQSGVLTTEVHQHTTVLQWNTEWCPHYRSNFSGHLTQYNITLGYRMVPSIQRSTIHTEACTINIHLLNSPLQTALIQGTCIVPLFHFLSIVPTMCFSIEKYCGNTGCSRVYRVCMM